MNPFCAISSCHKYVEPPHAFVTTCAPGPPYVYTSTGYFFAGSKFGGLIIIALSSIPSCDFTCKNSTGDKCNSSSAGTLFSLITAAREPSACIKSCLGGTRFVEYVSTYAPAPGANFTACVPSSFVMRANPVPSSPTRYKCPSNGDFSVAVKYTIPFASSTPCIAVTSHSPFVNCTSCFPSMSYK